jgi:hypothetical protein
MLITEFQRDIHFAEITGIEDLSGRKHVISSSKNHPGNCNDGSFLTSSLGNTLILDSVVRTILGFDRSVSDLNQSRLGVNTGSGDANRLFLASGFVVAGR